MTEPYRDRHCAQEKTEWGQGGISPPAEQKQQPAITATAMRINLLPRHHPKSSGFQVQLCWWTDVQCWAKHLVFSKKAPFIGGRECGLLEAPSYVCVAEGCLLGAALGIALPRKLVVGWEIPSLLAWQNHLKMLCHWHSACYNSFLVMPDSILSLKQRAGLTLAYPLFSFIAIKRTFELLKKTSANPKPAMMCFPAPDILHRDRGKQVQQKIHNLLSCGEAEL